MKNKFLYLGIATTVLFVGTATVLGYISTKSHSVSTVIGAVKPSITTLPTPQGQRREETAKDSYKLLYLESDGNSSTIWSASPDSVLATREQVITLTHAEGYPIKASLSPKSEYLAYTLLSEGNNPAFNGSLWIMGTQGQVPKQVAMNIDYGWPPKWSNDGSYFIYIKKIPLTNAKDKYHNEIYIGSISGETKLLFSDEESLEIVPVGWSSDGNFIYVDLINNSGDDLYEIEHSSGASRFVAHISESAAWGLSLSPDSKTVIGSILTARDKPKYAVISVSIDNGEIKTVLDGADHHYTPIWNPIEGEITTHIPDADLQDQLMVLGVSNKQGKAKPALKNLAELGARLPNLNKTVPVKWSPNGQWLAIEAYHGSLVNFALVHPSSGDMYFVPSTDWIEFVGWVRIR